MSLTIKEAKDYRCSDNLCKRWHHTCRRCEHHTSLWTFNRKAGLCSQCNQEYQEWYNETIRKPAIKAFDAEKEAGGDPDWSPFQLTAAYSEWIKEAPRKSRKVIDLP